MINIHATKWLVLFLLLSSCSPAVQEAPVEVPPQKECLRGELLVGNACCQDFNRDGACDVPEKEIPEPEPEPTINPVYLFRISFIDDKPPAKIFKGEPFDIAVQVTSNSNVPLPPNIGHVRWVYANPRTFGLTSLKDFRRDITTEFNPGETMNISFDDIVLEEDYNEQSSINFEVKFCYEVTPPREYCIVLTKLIGIR